MITIMVYHDDMIHVTTIKLWHGGGRVSVCVCIAYLSLSMNGIIHDATGIPPCIHLVFYRFFFFYYG